MTGGASTGNGNATIRREQLALIAMASVLYASVFMEGSGYWNPVQ
jgi:hypothetical protein